ncbi:MAG TPA: hypothetical protein VFD13_00450, partial [Candidatus Kapabacteria bacterium]|nr:hypothetical protein [Candidatus Kapabacteria bacterium]
MRPIQRYKFHLAMRALARIVGDAGIVAAIALWAISGIPRDASAQNALIQHKISQEHLSPPTTGREFWFAIPTNAWGITQGKYLRIYITSAYNTTAYIGKGTSTFASVAVSAYKITSFDAPFTWELGSSGYVEDNAIHVWSKDADLTVYFMSHITASTDGSFIIPTIGWGTNYVVAGYEALFEGTVDFPSEFTIAANTDNTEVTITPSCDLRKATGPSSNPTDVGFAQGQTFHITMNRGQSVQFLSVQAQGTEGYDVTGTIIQANEPVGVIGGSVATNIPIDYQYADHVEDMMPPARTWAETYYSTFFTQPAGEAGHDFGMYLFVSSKPNQTIWHHDQVLGSQPFPAIPNQYGYAWEDMELAQKFWSDAPFMVVEYINSASYPDGKNGYGDPAEVIINPREQYTKTVVFQTPSSQGSAAAYSNYATVTVNVNDANRTTFDGQAIKQYKMQPIDDTFEVFTVPNLSAGTHSVTGDSAGAGVYIYGYGPDESYAWSGGFGTGTFHATDTIPPRADTINLCYNAFVHLADSGFNPGGIAQSKLNKIQVDSNSNMTFTLDSNWAEGVGLDTSGYGMSVTDRSKPAYLHVTVYDVSGNLTTITSTYQPNFAIISPPIQDFGTVSLTGSATLYDTIRNTGTTPFDIKQLQLKLDTEGFTLVSPDLSPLAVGATRILEIQFTPKKGQEAYDTILFGNECLPEFAVVEGNAGAPDFSVDDQYWTNVPLQKDTGWVQLPVVIHNKSASQNLTVQFVSVSDPTHFYLA